MPIPDGSERGKDLALHEVFDVASVMVMDQESKRNRNPIIGQGVIGPRRDLGHGEAEPLLELIF